MSEENECLSYREQLRHTGSTGQLYSVRRWQLCEGAGDGLRMIEVCTAAGLRALFCESRALDLYELQYKGVNIGFQSKNGLLGSRALPVAPNSFAPTWPGGMLATCGLRNTGSDCQTESEYFPAHGRINSAVAGNIVIDCDPEQGRLVIGGRIGESALFGPNLVLKRQITIPLNGSTITWQDEVLNLAAEEEPVFLLYHFNFGYPFLGPKLQLHFPQGQIIPRTEVAKSGLSEYDQICEPVDGYPEQVFFHLPLPGGEPEQEIRLVRPDLRLTASLKYSAAELPVLVQWKSMKSGDYALGIEPSTSKIRGRAAELADGYDQIIKGYGRRAFHLSLSLTSLD